MDAHPLDNPMWHALVTTQAHVAIGGNNARRYPSQIAPFAALRECDEAGMEELAIIVLPGETVCILNESFAPPSGWSVLKQEAIVQMVWNLPTPEMAADPKVSELGESDISEMLDLTALVYPAYFRRGTAELGTYFGVRAGKSLQAMAGTRMAITGYREISGVCVHTEARGQGLARRLVRHLLRHIHAKSEKAFLHTEADNVVARSLYEGMGFEVRRSLPLWVIRREF